MSKTLNLVDRLLARGRALHNLGCSRAAMHVLTCLSTLGELPASVAEETQALLADLQLERLHYVQARRHLTAALAYQPASAGHNYQMGTAFDRDQAGDPERAYHYFQRSLELDPDQPECLADFGLLALTLGRTEEGLEALRRAAELLPNHADTVAKLVEGLSQLDLAEEAEAILREALFRNSQDPDFHRLWSDFRFQQAREVQLAKRHQTQANAWREEDLVLLPFLRVAPDTLPSPAARKRVRRDGPYLPAPPHLPRPSRWPGRKHA
jgi:tetratricopeptide (TPR) repeat protein